MIRPLVAWSLSFRLVVIPAAAALLLVAGARLRDAPVDVLPEFAPTYVEVQTEALGLSASEVEELITVPLERDLLNGVAGVETIRSESVLGLSSITLVFEPGTDLLDARQLVQEGEPFGPALVLRGALERLSPILMTALATGLALVPLLAYGDIPGHEVELPMAVVIVGGLVTSTLLNLFVVPLLYLRFARSSSRALSV